MADQPIQSISHHRLVLLVFCAVFAYFFQGGGWNPNSRLDTIRAVVETGSLNIAPYCGNTGDYSSKDGVRYYSNKPPGFALLGVPVYAVLYHTEKALGIDPQQRHVVHANTQVLNLFLVGLPSACMALLAYQLARRENFDEPDALLVAAALGFGTMILPNAGALGVHSLVASAIFAAWFVLSEPQPKPRAPILAGLFLGTAAACDYTIAPVVLLFLAWVWNSRGLRSTIAFLLAPAAWVLVLLICNKLSFDQFLVTNNTYQKAEFATAHLFLGMFDWPQWNRIYWLTLHPLRGLLYNSPVLILGVAGLVLLRPIKSLGFASLIPPAVIAYFFLVNLCFNGWTGGWGFGPRYLLPAVPFLFIYALPVFRRFPKIAWPIAGLSMALLFCVASVALMWPAEADKASSLNPIYQSVRFFFDNQVSIAVQSMLDLFPMPGPDAFWKSYNLGEVAGLRGSVSTLPCALLIAGYVGYALRLRRWRGGAPAGPVPVDKAI